MSIVSRLLERRGLNDPQLPLTSTALAEWMDGAPSASGVTVTPRSALQHIAVYRCVELISGTCAALPLKAYRVGTKERVNSPVLGDPHPELTKFEVWETIYASLLLWGNAFAWKGYDGRGQVRRLYPIHPSRVDVEIITQRVTDDPSDPLAPGTKRFVIDGNREEPWTRRQVLHIPGLGYDGRVGLSRIKLAAQGISVGLAAEAYAARFYGNGSLFSGILSTEQTLTEDSAKRLKGRWKEKVSGLANAHDIAVLDSGAKFMPVSMPPEDAQLLQSRGYSTTEIARLFGLPPHAIGDVEKSTSWGTGIEQQTIGMVQFTLQPSYLTRVEQRMTKEVLLNPDYYAEHVVEGILRGDSAARATFYSQMRAMKAMSANEVRVRENLEPYDGGDVYENPNILSDDDQDPDVDNTGDRSLERELTAERRHTETMAHLAAMARQRPVVNVSPPNVSVAAPRVEAPVVNVTVPESPPRIRTIERDDAGDIARIVEE